MLTATCQMQLLLALAIYGLPLVRCHCTWHWQYVDCHMPAHQPWPLAQAPRPLKAPRASTNDSARGALARPKQCCIGPSPHKKKRPLGQLHQPNNLGAVHQAGPQEKAPRAAAPAQKTWALLTRPAHPEKAPRAAAPKQKRGGGIGAALSCPEERGSNRTNLQNRG